MSDPLGLIGRVGANPGVTPGVTPVGPGGPAGGAGGPSFKDVLMDNIRQVNDLQAQATSAMEELAAGRRNDVEGVLLATQKADTAFKMLLAVRNKVQAAFEEVKQMRV
jgi:flagellar hook-basal body complex protein FliE